MMTMDRPHTDDLTIPAANNLTALRLVAALCVVVSHCALLRSGHESADPLASLNRFNLGDHALNVFFFISGLTVTASLMRSQSVVAFIASRVLRLWPALIIVVALTALVAAPLVSSASPRVYFETPAWAFMIAKSFFLSGATGSLPGVFETNPLPNVVNGPPWTLRFEALCYAGLLCGSLATRAFVPRARALWIPVATILAGLVMIVAPAGDVATTLDHLLRFWVAFGLGATVYSCRALLRPTPVAVASCIIAGGAFYASIGGRFECVAAIVFTSAATVCAARVPLGRLRRFANRYDLSYGIYITAWPITQILVVKAPPMPSLVALVALVVGLSGTLAFGSWTLIERPALGCRPRVVATMNRAWTALSVYLPRHVSIRRQVAG